MNKQQLFTAAIATTILTSGFALLATNAAEPTNAQGERPSREEMKAHHDAVKAAIEANDYTAWVEAMSEHPKADEFVNEETFAVMVQAHELAQSGEKEAAKELLEENGIHRPGKRGHGPKSEHHEAVREAIESGDYEAWVEALSSHPNAEELISEENFATMQKAHELMESGEKEAAKELLEEAGFKRPERSER